MSFINSRVKCPLTLHEAASKMHPELQGAFNARPYNNLFRGLFDPIFSYNLDWGTEILEKYF